MKNITDYLKVFKNINKGPRIKVAELTNMNTPDLEQSPDSFLRPGETLEDWDVSFRRPNAHGGRIGYDDGQLVRNTVDGSRPGYEGPPSLSKYDITKSKISTEMKSLTKKYNKILNKAIQKGNLSTAPEWATFLNNQKLKHAGVDMFRALAGPNNPYGIDFGVVKIYDQKRILANKLIAEAGEGLKHVPWMDIQRKISSAQAIDTNSWRALIDKHNKINGQAAKVSQAFDHLLKNDVQLNIPKNLSKTMAAEGSLLRKVIADLTGAGKKGIVEGLNSNKNYINKLEQINFANKSNLWTTGQGTTLLDILDDAAYRMDGNISWTSDIKKLAGRPSKNTFEYALRHFNHHGKNRTGKSQIRFFKKGGGEIFWDDILFDNKGGKKLKPSEVYFIDSTDPTRTKWNTAKMEADHKNWTRNKKTTGLFDELYKAKDVYDNLLTSKVIDPFNPKGPKVNFGALMKDVYGEGFDFFGNPYSIDHGDGVNKNPFKNLRIAPQRINKALYDITRKTGISESVKKQILKQLNKQVFSPSTKDVIPKIIKGQTKLISDVLTEGKKFDQPIVKSVETLTQGKEWNKAIKSSKAKMLAKTLELAGIDITKMCSNVAAGGGRIGFATKKCGWDLVQQNEDAFMKKAANHPEAADLFKSGNMAKHLKNAKKWARANMGPAGWIGGELLIMGLGSVWDMSQGKGWKEALDNWTGLGGHFGQAEKRLKEIGIEQGYSEEQINEAMKIGQLMDLSTEVEGKQWELDQIQEQQDIGGTARYKSDPNRRFVRPRGYLRGEYQDPKRIRDLKTETPKMWEKGTELYESLKDYDFSVGAYDEMQQKKKREEYDRMMELRSMPMMPGYGQQFQVSGKPEFKPVTYGGAEGGRAGYMGGGIAAIRKPHAIPPERQGLRSIMINVNDD